MGKQPVYEIVLALQGFTVLYVCPLEQDVLPEEDLETHFPQVKPEFTQMGPCCNVCPDGQLVRFFVYPDVQTEQSRAVLDPVHVPVVVQLVHVMLLPPA